MSIGSFVTSGFGAPGSASLVISDGMSLQTPAGTNAVASIITEGFGVWSTASKVPTQGFGQGGSTPVSTVVRTFTRDIVFPLGTTITSVKYEIRDSSGVVNAWSTNGLVVTPNMTGSATQPPGYTVNYSVTANNADGSFAGILIARTADAGGTYDVQALNIQPTSAAGATVRAVSLMPSQTTDTWTTPGYRPYQGTTALDIRRTSGAVAITEITKAYFVDATFAPSTKGDLHLLMRWDGDNTLFMSDMVRFHSYRPGSAITTVEEEITFPLGATLGTVQYEIRNTSGTVVTPWTSTGLNLVPGVTASATQPACYVIDATIAANNPDGSFTGYLICRADSSASLCVVKPINTQAYLKDTTVKIAKVSAFLSTDTVTSAGRRAYQNTLGTDTALEARSTNVTAIPEVTNGYVTLLTQTPAADGSFQGFVVWDGGAEPYHQDYVLFPASNGETIATGGGTSKKDKKLKRTIRFSDLDYRERLEALKDLPVKPFSELEQAAVQLAAADEDEQEDDEAVLLAIMKVLIH